MCWYLSTCILGTLGVCMTQHYDADGNGTIDVQEFSSLIFDVYQSGACWRIIE